MSCQNIDMKNVVIESWIYATRNSLYLFDEIDHPGLVGCLKQIDNTAWAVNFRDFVTGDYVKFVGLFVDQEEAYCALLDGR